MGPFIRVPQHSHHPVVPAHQNSKNLPIVQYVQSCFHVLSRCAPLCRRGPGGTQHTSVSVSPCIADALCLEDRGVCDQEGQLGSLSRPPGSAGEKPGPPKWQSLIEQSRTHECQPSLSSEDHLAIDCHTAPFYYKSHAIMFCCAGAMHGHAI